MRCRNRVAFPSPNCHVRYRNGSSWESSEALIRSTAEGDLGCMAKNTGRGLSSSSCGRPEAPRTGLRQTGESEEAITSVAGATAIGCNSKKDMAGSWEKVCQSTQGRLSTYSIVD